MVPEFSGAEPAEAEVIGEYCAEMAGRPVLMIRRGDWKYIHCESDPAQLFNLSLDPDELTNLADDPLHRGIARDFADEVAQRWDISAMTDAVLASQSARQAVHSAMEAGAPVHWDYAPPYDAASVYVRNHMDWTEAAARLRYPRQDSDQRSRS